MTPPFAMNIVLHETALIFRGTPSMMSTILPKAKIEHQRDLTPLPNSADSDLLPKDAIHVCNHDFYVNFLSGKFL